MRFVGIKFILMCLLLLIFQTLHATKENNTNKESLKEIKTKQDSTLENRISQKNNITQDSIQNNKEKKENNLQQDNTQKESVKQDNIQDNIKENNAIQIAQKEDSIKKESLKEIQTKQDSTQENKIAQISDTKQDSTQENKESKSKAKESHKEDSIRKGNGKSNIKQDLLYAAKDNNINENNAIKIAQKEDSTNKESLKEIQVKQDSTQENKIAQISDTKQDFAQENKEIKNSVKEYNTQENSVKQDSIQESNTKQDSKQANKQNTKKDSILQEQNVIENNNTKQDSKQANNQNTKQDSNNMQDDRKNGFFVDMSINITAINHIAINNTGNTTSGATKTTNISGVESMFFLNLGYIYDDEYKYEFGLGFGATPLNIKGSYPFGIDNALTQDFTFTRAIAIRVPSSSKVGINLSQFNKNYVHSRYINLGLDSDMFIHASGIAPFSATISMLDFYLEYEGSKKMNKNLCLEYSGALGYTLGATQIMGINGSVTPKLKLFDFSNATHGFLLRGSIGARYRLGVRANAFIKGIFTYRYMSSQTKETPIVNASAVEGDVIIPDARANARYPAFNMVYGGLQFGVGF